MSNGRNREKKILFSSQSIKSKIKNAHISKIISKHVLQTIYTLMLTSTNIQWSQFQQMLTDHVENLDFCYYSWECFASIVQQLNADKTNVYIFINLLGMVKIPTEKKENDKLLFHNNSMYT